MTPRSPQITRRQVYKSGSTIGIGPLTVRYLTLALLGILSLLFLVQSAQGADKGIRLREIDQKKSEWDKKNASLQVEVSRIKALEHLSDSAAQQGLVPQGDITDSVTVPSSN